MKTYTVKAPVVQIDTYEMFRRFIFEFATTIINGIPMRSHFRGCPVEHASGETFLIRTTTGVHPVTPTDVLVSVSVNDRDIRPIDKDLFYSLYTEVVTDED